MGFKILDLRLNGKGPFAGNGDHAQHLVGATADEVGVVVVEAIHQRPAGNRLMLGDFLDEGTVVEPMNLLELRFFGGDLELKWGGHTHSLLPFSARARNN